MAGTRQGGRSRAGATTAGRAAGTRGAARAAEPLRERVDGGIAELIADRDRARAFALLIDGAPQSHVDLDDPAHLDFAYQRRIGHVVDLVAPPARPLHALHLGGGALTIARYTAATRPRSTQQVIELDAALTRLVRRELPLERSWRIKVRTGDAREGLARMPEGWADLVVVDVFGGARVPSHLTSVEFLDEAVRVLRPGGWYTANLADGGPLGFLRGQVATARSRFEETMLAADPAVLRGRRFGNALLLAANRELPIADLTRRIASDPHPGRVEHGRPLRDFTGGAVPVTDETARASPAPPESAFR